MKNVNELVIEYNNHGTWTDIELVLDAYGSNTIAQTTALTAKIIKYTILKELIMFQVGDRVKHTWQITNQTVTGTVVELTTKDGENAVRIQFDSEQRVHPEGDSGTEIIVAESAIHTWQTV